MFELEAENAATVQATKAEEATPSPRYDPSLTEADGINLGPRGFPFSLAPTRVLYLARRGTLVRRSNLSERASAALNVARFAITHPAQLPEMARKIVKRTRGDVPRPDATNLEWIDRHSESARDFARSIDSNLWDEAETFEREFRPRAEEIVAGLPSLTGGGGDYRFLYWLTRLVQPSTIVETGVAAGWTSQAFLAALKRNGTGKLYSSDFPYFRAADPEELIGAVVDADLEANWCLMIEGDAKNLPRILARIGSIDIFHYDSDKSHSGRTFAIELIRPRLAQDALVLMDDIADNSWFKDFVSRENLPFRVFDRRLGLIGQIDGPLTRRKPQSRLVSPTDQASRGEGSTNSYSQTKASH